MRVSTAVLLGWVLATVSACVHGPPTRPGSAPASPRRPAERPGWETQLADLERAGKPHAVLAFVASRKDSVDHALTRSRLLLGEARAYRALGKDYSALTSLGQAWSAVAPRVPGLGAEVLHTWADTELDLGRAEEAARRYEQLLEEGDLAGRQRQDVMAGLALASRAAGDLSRSGELIALLGSEAHRAVTRAQARLDSPFGVVPPLAGVARAPSVGSRAPAATGVRPRMSWQARATACCTDPMALIRSVTVHHSDMVAPVVSNGVPSHLRGIQSYHMGDLGWADIGYHYLVDAKGEVWEGRPLSLQGAHAGGDNNIGNIGVCLLGDFEENPVPTAQLEGMRALLDTLLQRHHLTGRDVFLHSEFKATVCPGRFLRPHVLGYRAGARSSLARQSSSTSARVVSSR